MYIYKYYFKLYWSSIPSILFVNESFLIHIITWHKVIFFHWFHVFSIHYLYIFISDLTKFLHHCITYQPRLFNCFGGICSYRRRYWFRHSSYLCNRFRSCWKRCIYNCSAYAFCNSLCWPTSHATVSYVEWKIVFVE